jgi:hypothetical protein
MVGDVERECRFLGIEECGYRYAAGIGRIIAEVGCCCLLLLRETEEQGFGGRGKRKKVSKHRTKLGTILVTL